MSRIKRWVSGAPAGEHQLDILLSNKYFSHHFGAKYEDLTIKQLRYLGKTADTDCRQLGEMTAAQLSTATAMLSEGFQEKWTVSPRAQPDESLIKAALKDTKPAPPTDATATSAKEAQARPETPPAPTSGISQPKDVVSPNQPSSAASADTASGTSTPPTQSKMESLVGKLLDKLGKAADKATDKALEKLDK